MYVFICRKRIMTKTDDDTQKQTDEFVCRIIDIPLTIYNASATSTTATTTTTTIIAKPSCIYRETGFSG